MVVTRRHGFTTDRKTVTAVSRRDKPARKRATRAPEAISESLIDTITERLALNERVRRSLPLQGRIHIDRQLPFLCVYRRPAVEPDAGMKRIATSEASYLLASGLKGFHPSLTRLVTKVVRSLGQAFGGFLLLEIWSAELDANDQRYADSAAHPGFRVFAPRGEAVDNVADAIEQAFKRVTVRGHTADVQLVRTDHTWPGGLQRLLKATETTELKCTVIGLEVAPIYRDPRSGRTFPVVLRDLEHEVSRALRQVFFTFARKHTTLRPRHYHGLGRRAMVKAVWEVDRRLSEVSNSFDFLLQVTPANAQRAWLQFKKSDYEKPPAFRYRPLPVDPVLLKRSLYATPLERLEDPAIRQLLGEKQDELGRRITMLLDIDTPRFVHGSVQLYGELDPQTVTLARQILDTLPSRTRDDSKLGTLTPQAFAQLAEAEIAHYRAMYPKMNGSVHVRDDVTGLMVSRGSLLVSRQGRIPRARAEALIQHEVGTHMVTYYNGRAQPFRQLYSGLAGYEALQEGLAVFAEYLVGGLSRPRLRLIAARVLAVQRLLQGASFIDTFREFDRSYDFERRTAFVITMRVYRGGGLTKDAVYLKGLLDLLAYLKNGGSLQSLLVGKLAVEHVPIIEELQWRQVLKPPILRPRFLDAPGAEKGLARARSGLNVLDLVAGFKKR